MMLEALIVVEMVSDNLRNLNCWGTRPGLTLTLTLTPTLTRTLLLRLTWGHGVYAGGGIYTRTLLLRLTLT